MPRISRPVQQKLFNFGKTMQRRAPRVAAARAAKRVASAGPAPVQLNIFDHITPTASKTSRMRTMGRGVGMAKGFASKNTRRGLDAWGNVPRPIRYGAYAALPAAGIGGAMNARNSQLNRNAGGSVNPWVGGGPGSSMY